MTYKKCLRGFYKNYIKNFFFIKFYLIFVIEITIINDAGK